MQILHVPTLIFVNSILLMVVLVTHLVNWRLNPGVPGVRHWAAGNLSAALGVFLLLARTFLHPLFTIVLANFLIVLGFYVIYLGIRKYLDRRPKGHEAFILFMGVFTALFLYFTFIDGSYRVRSIIFSFYVSAICFVSAYEVLAFKKTYDIAHWTYGMIMGLHGAFNLARAIFLGAEISAGVTESFLEGGGMARALFAEATVFILAMTMSYVLLTSSWLAGRLRRRADIDDLTEVFNRRAFLFLTEKASALARRKGYVLSLLAIDIDHFKRINDTHGHSVGDAALKEFARMTSALLRSSDIMGRVGGEEFMVLLPETSRIDACSIAERIRAAVERSSIKNGRKSISLTVSIGVSIAPCGDKTFHELSREADSALYCAKNSGRNQVKFFGECSPQEQHGMDPFYSGECESGMPQRLY